MLALSLAFSNAALAQKAPPSSPPGTEKEQETLATVGKFTVEFLGRIINLVIAVDECDRTGKCANLRERDRQMLSDMDRLERIVRDAPTSETWKEGKLAEIRELRQRYTKEVQLLLFKALQKHGA